MPSQENHKKLKLHKYQMRIKHDNYKFKQKKEQL